MKAARFVGAWIICVIALAMFGCTPAITKARQAIAASAALGSSAADLFGAVDAQEQRDIAAQLMKDHDIAKAEAAKDDWRKKQTIAVKTLKVYNTTISGLGALAELQDQNGKLDIGNLLTQLAAAYAQLVNTLASFGVTLPKGVL